MIHRPSSIRFYFFLLLLLALAGFIASIYLTYIHYRNFTDISYQSFCAINSAINCDTVAQSPYAILFDAPIAAWGALGYFFIITSLVVFKPIKTQFVGTVLQGIVAAAFSLVSVILALASIFYIHSYCLMCIILYGINFGLLYLTWLAKRRFGAGSFRANLRLDIACLRERRKQALASAFANVILAGALIFFYPHYWLIEALPVNTQIEHGTTEDGTPWTGAKNPSLTITEYTDYLCFQCGKMHHYLRQLISQYPDQIRLIHRHFPLDSQVNPLIKETVHPNSGLLSFFALMAQEQNLFWQVNDALFREARSKQSINFSAIAKETGMNLSQFQEKLNDPGLHQKLAEDIRSGLRLYITSTPSYVVDGKVYSGTIPTEIIAAALKKTL